MALITEKMKKVSAVHFFTETGADYFLKGNVQLVENDDCLMDLKQYHKESWKYYKSCC